MKRATLALGVILLIVTPLACMTQKNVPNTEPTVPILGTIDLIIIDERGWPIPNVAVFDDVGGVYVAESGGLSLTVSRPVTLIAYKPNYAPSHPQTFHPGLREIVLLPIGRVNE